MAARNTVSVRIALEGGDTVKAQLRTLGQSFEQIGAAAGRLVSSFQRFGAASQAFNGALNSVVGQTARLGLAITGAVASVGFLAKSSADSANGVQALANQLGLTTERVQQLQAAFAQRGVGPDQLTQALTGVQDSFRTLRDELATPLPGQPQAVEQFKELGVTVTRAGQSLKTIAFDQFGRKLADGVKPAIQTFEDFGVTVRRFGDAYKGTAASVTANPLAKLAGLSGLDLTTALGESPEKQLFLVFEALAKVQNQAERVNIAKSLGIGPELLAVVKSGTLAIQAFSNRLATAFDANAIADAQRLSSAFVNLRFVATQTKNAMGAVFAEGGQGASAIEQFTSLIEDNRAGLVNFARDVRNVVMPEVQNFILLLSGKDVPTSSIFSGLKIDIPAAAAAIRDAVQSVIVPAFQALFAVAQGLAGAFKFFTGKEVSAAAIVIGAAFLQLTGVFRLFGTAIGLARASVALLAAPLVFLGRTLIAVGSLLSAGFLLPFRAVAAVFGTAASAVLLFAARVTGIIALADLVVTNFQRVKEFFGGLFTGIGQIWQGDIAAGLGTLKDTFLAAVSGLKDASLTTWLEIAASATLFFGPAGIIARLLIAGIVLAFTLSFDTIKSVAAAGWQAVSDGASKLVGSLGSVFTSIGDALRSAFDSAISFVTSRLDALIKKIQSIGRAISGAFSNSGSVPSVGNPAGDGGGFASGGRVLGPGSGTSDSILARLSNGEYVIRAAMVRRFGVSFFDALNAGRSAFRNTQRFATGGLVLPRFATGGLVSPPALGGAGSGGLAPVNLHFGGQVIEGLLAPEDVIKRISRAASVSQLSSTGRKPTWQGGY